MVRRFVLTCLLEVDAVGGTVERDLALLTAALRADAPVHRRAEALFFANIADRAVQDRTPQCREIPAQSSHYGIFHPPVVCQRRMSSGFARCDLWKTRMKSGENAFHRDEVGIR